jgi:hypothetical protein
VNLRTWQGFGASSVKLDKAKQGALYLHQMWKRVPKPSDPMDTDDNVCNYVQCCNNYTFDN